MGILADGFANGHPWTWHPKQGRSEEIVVFLGVVGAIHALHPQMFREGFDAFRSRCRVQGQSCVFVNFAFSFW